MLVLKLELHDARTGAVSEIGKLTIANTGAGWPERGDYEATLTHTNVQGKVKRPLHTTLNGFPRKRKNAWDLVYNVLQSMIGYKNPAYAYADSALYIKNKNGEFLQVAQFEGWPADGVFLVYKEPSEHRSWTGYTWLGEIPANTALTYAAARVHYDRACRAVTALREKTCREHFRSEHHLTRQPLPPHIATLTKDYLVSSASPSLGELVDAVLDAIAKGQIEETPTGHVVKEEE